MKTHWMIYVKWHTIVKWKGRMDLDSEPGQREYPFQYASNGRRFREIKAGDVLWVVTNPRYSKTGRPVTYGRPIPIAVMARLRVRTVCCQGDDTTRVCGKKLPSCSNVPNLRIHQASDRLVGDILVVGEADADDAGPLEVTYPPLYNIFGILDQLAFQNKRGNSNLDAYLTWVKSGNYWRTGVPEPGKDGPGPHWRLGQHLQSLRKLTPGAGTLLDGVHTSAVNGRRVFFSYRHADVKNLAEEATPKRSMEQWMAALAEELKKKAFVSWLDKHQILDNGANIGLLDQTLRDGVRQAAFFVALITPDYAVSKRGQERNWTREEWESAGKQVTNPSRRNQLIRIGLLCGGDAGTLPKEPTDRFVETKATPQAIARAIDAVAAEIA
jgi:hypothetical protein